MEVKEDPEDAGYLSRVWAAFYARGRVLVWDWICELCFVFCDVRGFFLGLVGACGVVDRGLPFLSMAGAKCCLPCVYATLADAVEPGGVVIFLCGV